MLRRFAFLQNQFEMRSVKKLNCGKKVKVRI